MFARPRRLALMAATLAAVAVCLESCSAGYVLRSAWYEAEMLGSRVPIDKVRASGRLTTSQLRALAVIEDAKSFGREIGLQATKNYDSVAVGFEHHIWSVSACAPL